MNVCPSLVNVDSQAVVQVCMCVHMINAHRAGLRTRPATIPGYSGTDGGEGSAGVGAGPSYVTQYAIRDNTM